MIYLKVVNGEVEAYGDEASVQAAEQEYNTGTVYQKTITEDEWAQANYHAYLDHGEIKLGYDPNTMRHQQEDIVRSERKVKLRLCDRVSPMYWETLTEEEKQSCRDYRQALLDITKRSGFPWDGDLRKVPWPDRPRALAALTYTYDLAQPEERLI